MIERHLDTIKGLGAAALNMVAVAVSHAALNAMLTTISLLVGITVGALTIWEKIRKGRDLKVAMIALSIALSGCTTPALQRHTLETTARLTAASGAVVEAKAATTRAQVALVTSEDALAALRKRALPRQRPAIQAVEGALREARREHAQVGSNLELATRELAAARISLERLSERAATAEREALGYRRLKLWLALLMGGAAGYVAFRMIPAPLGPVRYYAMAGAAGVAVTFTYWIL